MRRSSPRDVAVVTPWYPTRQVPFGGAFVQAMVEATAPGCDRVTLLHVDGWGARISATQDEQVWAAHQSLLRRGVPVNATVAGADLRYVPVPVRVGLSFAELAARHAAALRIALGDEPIAAAVVHAHVGLRGGWTALENAAPGARVFVTEHATFLDKVLAEPDSRAMYDEVIARSTGFFAVGRSVSAPLLAAFPHHAGKIESIANPIAFGAPRPEPVRRLRRWLYVGTLSQRKGVDQLLAAFARCHAEDPELTLTYVGGGALQASLAEQAAALGLADAVTITGYVLPERALAALREHDLLVHPSRFETFGMTIVEAIASGLPVLVTRCGGPQESLAGIETAAGEMVDVEDTADGLVAGYQRLRSRFPDGLDLPRAQRVLRDRYGYQAVAAAHHRAWFPEPAVTGPAPAERSPVAHRTE